MTEKRLTKEIAEQFLADDKSVDLREFTEVDDDAAMALLMHSQNNENDNWTYGERTAAVLVCLVWFCTPFVVMGLLAGLDENNKLFPKDLWFWSTFVFWPFSYRCCHSAFVDTKRRVGFWTSVVFRPLGLLAVVVIGIPLITALRGFGFL
jgi:hypothetical protein